MARAACFLLSSLVAIGCGGRYALSSARGARTDGGAGPGADAKLDTVADQLVESAPETSPRTCAELAAEGAPDSLVGFSWAAQDLAACPLGGCLSGFAIRAVPLPVGSGFGCEATLDRPGSKKVHTLSANECSAARGWLSNPRFLGAVRTGLGCEAGAREESFAYQLADKTSASRATNFCAEPTVELVRGCLRDLVRPLIAGDVFFGPDDHPELAHPSKPTCEELAANGVPDALGTFSWLREWPRCAGDRPCSSSMGISSCELTMIRDFSYRATLEIPPADCRRVRAFASNLDFLGVLRTGSGCDPVSRSERFDVGVNAVFGSASARDTDFCPEPRVEAVRNCVLGLAARLAGPSDAGDPPPAVPTCDELAAGGAPDALAHFKWTIAGETCAKPCVAPDVTELNYDCIMTLARGGERFGLALSQEDCVAARSWASNLQFLGVLRTGLGCEGKGREESFSYSLKEGSSATRQTNSCAEPHVQAVRTCLDALVSRRSGR